MYCSKETSGFYDPKLNEVMPGDAVEVSREQYLSLLVGRNGGLVIDFDSDGRPILVDPPPPSPEALAVVERLWRDTAISQVQWLVTRHRDEVETDRATTLSVEQFSELLAYVQSLRDWPASPLFPNITARPPVPEWLASQAQ
jgi:hypothetical protein